MTKKIVFISLFFAVINSTFSQMLFKQKQVHDSKQKNKRGINQDKLENPNNDVQNGNSSPFNNINGLINFNTDFKGASVLPSLKIWGSNLKDSSIIISFKNGKKIVFPTHIGINLFGSYPSYDSLINNNFEKLLLPEVSLAGFTIDYGIDVFSNFEIYGESNVLGKPFLYTNPIDTTKKLNEVSWVFHQKLGFEWIFIKNVVSVYSNLNILIPLENVDKFNSFYSVNNQTFHFFDMGLKLYLNLSSDNTTSFLFQPDIIFNSKDVKLLSNSHDIGFLNFKFSLLKQLK